MIRAYATFLARHWDHLLFGAILMALSSFGQTYFVALSGAAFRAEFQLTDGGLGGLYAAGTFASAITLAWAGRLIDRTSVRRYAWGVAAVLAGACALTALSVHAAMLLVAIYLLRLGGQGLMVHTALTATARSFPKDAGKALGIIGLGFALAQAALPLPAVFLLDHLGWRASWGVFAVVTVLGTALALSFLPRAAEEPHGPAKPAAHGAPALWRDPRLLLTLPAVLAAPFIGTGFFFHQARLAEQKGWTLAWVAGWFIVYAVVQAAAQLLIGPLIDRLGPKRVLPVFLLPMGLGMLVLFLTSAHWAAPAYLILTGLTSAVGGTLATALWVDLYGPAMLGRVRATVEAALVVASGASPFLMGYLIDQGVSLAVQALACSVYIAAASALATFVARAPAPAGLRHPGGR